MWIYKCAYAVSSITSDSHVVVIAVVRLATYFMHEDMG